MRKNLIKFIFATLLAGWFCGCCMNIPYYEIVNTPHVINLTSDDLQNLSNNTIFGKLISMSVNTTVTTNSQNPIEIVMKIFNLFPIKKIKAHVYENQKVMASGELIGFNIKTNGVIVEGVNTIITEQGELCPALNSGIKIGDRIVNIDGVDVNTNEEFNEIINLNKDITVHNIEYVRDGDLYKTSIPAVYDKITKTYRIGLWVKDETNGVGTLTYIKEDGSYGALGHAVIDSGNNTLSVDEGKLYECNLIGVEKGKRGYAGSLKGLFVNDDSSIGSITVNTTCGLIGKIKNNSKVFERAKSYDIGGRFSAKPGRAQILCEVQQGEAKLYDIEIIKASSHNNSKEKSMVIRVTDKELLELTGGIVQGMSGSPIIQDGRVVGAVTHVFVSDPSKGYGIYLDWMLEKLN